MIWSRRDPLTCQYSARTDLRFWMMLLIGAVFVYAGFTIEPSTNCNDSGECAPWLVPLGGVVGLGFVAMALGPLWANPQRGMRLDEATGELVWWQNRTADHPGEGGRIAPEQIRRIRLAGGDSIELHVYDQAGQRLPYLDDEVLPVSPQRWAEAMVSRWPHIVLVEEG